MGWRTHPALRACEIPLPNAAGATGRVAQRTMLGDDGNQTCRAEIT